MRGLQISGPSAGKDGAASSLVSPVGGGSSAYVSRDKAQGSVLYGQGGGGIRSPGAGAQIPMADMTSPRNAIGGISGVTNQAQFSNIMNRRKSNATANTHGPVDINAIMRA
jgi:hypothetical protein